MTQTSAPCIRVLYLDDCDIDHRLLDAYLKMDGSRQYQLTPCLTLDQARAAMASNSFDALIIDNRMPPFTSYHEPYRRLKSDTGFQGATLVVSADVSAQELAEDQRLDHEIVLDKADLLTAVRSGYLAQVLTTHH
jgi:CheY-like chemotaxis protein